jgi:hypothetical protein
MQYESSRALSLSLPLGVAVRAGVLAVADTANDRLVIADAHDTAAPAVRLGGSGAAGGEGLSFPSAVAFLADDHLVVVDRQNRALDFYRRAAGAWSYDRSIAGPGGELLDVAVDGASLFVLDATARRVLRVDPATGATAAYLADPRWERPSALAVGGGYLWVADELRHEIRRYDAALAVTVLGGFGAAPGRLREPSGLAYDAAGTLYVAERVGGRISAFTAAGALADTATVPAGEARLARVALDGAGRLFVADEATGHIHVLATAAAAAPATGLFPPEIDLGVVAAGLSATVAARLRNPGAAPLTVTGLTLAGTGFAFAPPAPSPPFVVSPGGERLVRVAFAPTAAGFRAAVLRATTGDPARPITESVLYAQAAPAEPFALALVLDTSGSMNGSSGAMSKIERLRAASALLLDLVAARVESELAVVTFASAAQTPVARAPIDGAQLGAAAAAIAAVAPGGSTSIGAGLQAAFAALASTSIARRLVIVVTDGMENRAPLIAEVPRPPGTQVLSIGLGLAEEIDVAKLQALATATSGTLQLTDGDDALLPKFYVQALSDALGEQVLLDPVFVPRAGKHVEHVVELADGDRAVTVILTWERIGSAFAVALVTPDGRSVDAEAVQVTRGERHLVARLALAGTRWECAGGWKVRVTCHKAVDGDRAMLNVAVASPHELVFDWRVRPEARRKGEDPAAAEPEIGPAGPMGNPRGRGGPPRLLRGDKLELIVRGAGRYDGLRFERGEVSVRSPRESLAAARARAAERCAPDPDDKPRRDPRPTAPAKGARDPERAALRVNGDKRTAAVAVPLVGPDGVHQLLVRVRFRTTAGHAVVRERLVGVLVEP